MSPDVIIGAVMAVTPISLAIQHALITRRHEERVSWLTDEKNHAEDSLLKAVDRVARLEQTVAAQAEENRRERAAHQSTWQTLKARQALNESLTELVDQVHSFKDEIRRDFKAVRRG